MFADSLEAVGFTGEKGQVVTFPGGDLTRTRVVVAVALPAEPTAEHLRRAAGQGVRAASKAAATSVAVALHPAGVDEVAAIAEGIELGAYSYDAYKSSKRGKGKAKAKKDTKLKSAVVLSPFARQTTATRAVDRAATVAAAVNAARDWVNTPPGDLRPPAFADAIAAHAGDSVKVSIWDEKRLARERCGGILGVGHRVGRTTASGVAHLHPRRCQAPPRPRRQGHHVRLRRTLAQARHVDADHEARHGRRRCRRRGDRGDRRARPPDQGHGLRLHRREHAQRHRHPSGRRADDAQRSDRRGPEHRRRGTSRAGRRPLPRQRGQARPHRRRRDPHREPA